MVRKTKNRHTALVVEDDEEMVDDLTGLLQSLGHDVVAVPSQEEAMNLLEAGEFCFALLDLQIKTTPDSIKPRVEAGKTLLRKIREAFPARNQEDHHHLQVLVMSGYAKEAPDIIQCLQEGADDFIVKPLGSNNPSVTTKIAECLRKSHRTSHEKCPAVMALAGKEPLQNAPRTTIPRPGIELGITGDPQGKRTGIVLNGKPIFLPNAHFLLLMRLVAGRFRDEHGWVHKTTLGSRDEQGFKGISNLNTVLQPFLPQGVPFYENDQRSHYRIQPGIGIGDINHEKLASHDTREVREIALEIRDSLRGGPVRSSPR